MEYFKQLKHGYYSKGLQYSIGNVEECSLFLDNGGVRIPWGKMPPQELFEAIECLAVLPTENQINTKMDTYFKLLHKLCNLKDLISPIELLSPKEKISLPCRTLSVDKLTPFDKRSRNDLLDIEFNHLKLLIINDMNSLNESIDLRIQKLPVLEYLETPLSENKFCSINNVLNINNMKHLILRHCKSKKIESLSSKFLLTLGLTNCSNKIEFIQDIYSLEILYLNSIHSEINCNIFKQLPNLKEINILNSKKIINIEALLDCNQLESIYCFRCNHIFNKKEQIFKEKKYKYLEINDA
jgi:hypothetical protein